VRLLDTWRAVLNPFIQSVAEPLVAPVVRTVRANYAMLPTDGVLLVNAADAAVYVGLPSAADFRGRGFVAKKVDASVNAVVLSAKPGETIDGASTSSLATQYAVVSVVSDGLNWYEI
jgi:hypothetical protein